MRAFYRQRGQENASEPLCDQIGVDINGNIGDLVAILQDRMASDISAFARRHQITVFVRCGLGDDAARFNRHLCNLGQPTQHLAEILVGADDFIKREASTQCAPDIFADVSAIEPLARAMP